MNSLSYKIKLISLHNKRDKEKVVFDRKMEKARQTGNREIIQETYHTESFPLEELDEEISVLMTQRLLSIAQKLLLPLPPKPTPAEGDVIIENDIWRQSNFSGKWYLRTKGVVEVRKLIRQEKKERLELITPWVAIIFGIIGAITGLIAVIKK